MFKLHFSAIELNMETLPFYFPMRRWVDIANLWVLHPFFPKLAQRHYAYDIALPFQTSESYISFKSHEPFAQNMYSLHQNAATNGPRRDKGGILQMNVLQKSSILHA